MDMKDRLKACRAARGMTQAQVATLAGISQPTYADLENGKSKTSAYLHRIADALGVTAMYLETGEGSRELDAESVRRSPQPTIKRIPVVGLAQGGTDGYLEEMGYPVGEGDGAIEWPSRDPNAYAVECRGDSMAPRIRHGEFVIAEPGSSPEPGEEVVIVGIDGRRMIKVFDYRRAGRVYLSSINRDHPQFSLDESEIVALHPLAGIAPRRARV